MAAAAPLSKPVSKRPIKRTATPAMSQRGKRPRPSDDVEPPPRKKDGGVAVGSGSMALLGGEVKPALRKGMYLAFIDDAFAQRQKVSRRDSLRERSIAPLVAAVASRTSQFAETDCLLTQGSNERYHELLSQFRSLLPNPSQQPSSTASSSTLPPTPSQLRIWLDALTHVVSKLDKTHTPLVETILAIPWATMDDQFVSAYVRFVGALVSARTEWLRSVLEKCVKGFKYRESHPRGDRI